MENKLFICGSKNNIPEIRILHDEDCLLTTEQTERLLELAKNPLSYMSNLTEQDVLNIKDYIIAEANTVKYAEEQEKRTVE